MNFCLIFIKKPNIRIIEKQWQIKLNLELKKQIIFH